MFRGLGVQHYRLEQECRALDDPRQASDPISTLAIASKAQLQTS